MPSSPPAGPVAQLLFRVLRESTGPGAELEVIDVGGGTGGLAVPLASAGHRVTVIDPSPDSLAALDRRAREAGVAGLITPVQGDLDDLVRLAPDGGAGVIVCHGVLEIVNDRAAALRAVVGALAPTGFASILTLNRLALVLQRAVAGRFTDAAERLHVTEPGPVDRTELLELLRQVGLRPRHVQGVRTVSDLVPGSLRDRDPRATEELAALEQAAAGHPALQNVAAQLHVIAYPADDPAAGAQPR